MIMIWLQSHKLLIKRHAHLFSGHFPGKARLAGCLLDSQSAVILILSILAAQAETAHTLLIFQSALYLLTLTIITIRKSFEAEIFSGWMPFQPSKH